MRDYEVTAYMATGATETIEKGAYGSFMSMTQSGSGSGTGTNYSAVAQEFARHSSATMTQAIGGNAGLAFSPATHGSWLQSILELDPVPVKYWLADIEELVEMVVDDLTAEDGDWGLQIKEYHIDSFNNAWNAYMGNHGSLSQTKLTAASTNYEMEWHNGQSVGERRHLFHAP
jgi:hypothetical protein